MKEPEVLNSIQDILGIFTKIYKEKFPSLYCFLAINSGDESYVFQELDSFPIKAVKSYRVNRKYYVLLNSFWKSNGKLKYVLPKSFFDIDYEHKKVFDWNEIETKKEKNLRNIITQKKPFKNYHFKKTQKEILNGKDFINANLVISIHDVKSINLYKGSFEIIGERFSMFAFCPEVESISGDTITGDSNGEKILHFDSNKLSFIVHDAYGEYSRELLYRWSVNGYEPKGYEDDELLKELFAEKKENKSDKGEINVGQFNIDYLDI